MGSSNSSLGSVLKRRLLSSLFCGASASHMGDDALRGSLQNTIPGYDVSVSSNQQSPSTFAFETGLTSFSASTGTSSGSTSDSIQNTSVKHSFSSHSQNSQLRSQQVKFDDTLMQPHVAASSLQDHSLPMESLSPPAEPLSALVGQEAVNLHSDGEPIADSTMDDYTADFGSDVSGSLVTSQPLPRFLSSVGEQGPIDTGMILVDMVSIHTNILSSSIAEIGNREERRNARRMFWDAFSRNSFRQNIDSPTIVFTTSHADDLESHDRWLLDFSGDLHYDGVGRESSYSGTRTNHRSRRQWQSRYEMSERFHDVDDDRVWQSSLCAMGLHLRGTCSCEFSFTPEEPSSRASITQVIMLADTLFEVLDEVHRHHMSLSLTMLTLPAPEAVVNSFPLKNYQKLGGTENGAHDAPQCNICLVDYEEGDKVRVLPCSHEYHMSCVDKWLKEIHGVCPLCRDDVRKAVAEGSTSSREIPSL